MSFCITSCLTCQTTHIDEAKTELKMKGSSKRGAGTFIVSSSEPITKVFDIEKKKLGEGAYGSVCKGVNKNTGAIRAIKTIPKARLTNLEKFKQEISIMKQLDHPNILYVTSRNVSVGIYVSGFSHSLAIMPSALFCMRFLSI